MAVINQDSSAKTGNYTKNGNVNMNKVRGYFATRKSTDLLTTAQLADPQAALLAKLHNDTYKNRAFMVGRLGMQEDNGEGVAYESREQYKLRAEKGTFDKVYTLLDGTWADYQQLVELIDGEDYDVSFFDDENRLWCKESATGIKGFATHELNMLPWTDPASGEVVKYKTRIALSDIDDLTKNAVHIPLGFSPLLELTGVEGVKLTDATLGGATAGQFDVKVEGCVGGINLADLYQGASELKQPAAWDCVNATGAAITITSVGLVMDGTTVASFRFVFDTADSDYDTGQPIYLKLKAISVIKGFSLPALEVGTPLVLTAS